MNPEDYLLDGIYVMYLTDSRWKARVAIHGPGKGQWKFSPKMRRKSALFLYDSICEQLGICVDCR